MEDFARALTDFVRDHQGWAAPIVMALAFGESLAFISLLIPAWGALVAIGALIGSSGISFWPIWLAAALGAAFGDWLSYWIGLKLEYRVQHIWPLSRHWQLQPLANGSHDCLGKSLFCRRAPFRRFLVLASPYACLLELVHFRIPRQGRAHRRVKSRELDERRLRHARQVPNELALRYRCARPVPTKDVVNLIRRSLRRIRTHIPSAQQEHLFGKRNKLGTRFPLESARRLNRVTFHMKPQKWRVLLKQVQCH